MDFGGGAVEFVIPALILVPDITALVIGFVGDICVSRRYAGEKTHSSTFLVMWRDLILDGLPYLAVEVDTWRYYIADRLAVDGTPRTGWACDLCQDDRGAVHRASVGYLDLLLYRKTASLPNTVIVCKLIADYVRFEDKNICTNCYTFACYKNISRTYTPGCLIRRID